MSEIIIHPVDDTSRKWAKHLLTEQWGLPKVVTRGKIHQADLLPGFVAEVEGERIGLVTYCIEKESCELVTLDSLKENIGIGSLLIKTVIGAATKAGCKDLWLITTNDNLHALGFYQKRGFYIEAIHKDAISKSRKIKPEIPMIGMDGIPIRDEIELKMNL